MKNLLLALSLVLVAAFTAGAAGWTLDSGPGQPGRVVNAKLDGKLVARFVYGPGQFKPYLHLYGADGELLTNGGLDADGKPTGAFPHHRGIFIGWKIKSDLGEDDLWHMTKGCRMEVAKLEKLDATPAAATLIATVEWRAGKKDAAGGDLLLTETRALTFTRPAGARTQVDARFTLRPARDLHLGGDLQHAGIHFRAANAVNDRKAETAYLWEPDLPGPGGKVASRELKWCRLVFPMGARWYEALQMTPPGQPVDELSWRDYGRFGFFFQRDLKAGEPLELNYRFIVQPVVTVAPAKLSAEQTAESRARCQREYEAFAGAGKR